MKVYGDLRSGNCLKVKYTADHLGIPCEWVPVDIMKQESRTPGYLARHPMGQVPAVDLGDGRRLSQSNAIIRYLAGDSRLLPDDRFLQAKVDEMLFWEQYSHEPYVAVCRFQMLYQGRPAEAREGWRVERGEQALSFLDHTLAERRWLVSENMTIADVSLLACSRLAPEGGFRLDRRMHLRRWITDCERELGIAGGSGAPG